MRAEAEAEEVQPIQERMEKLQEDLMAVAELIDQIIEKVRSTDDDPHRKVYFDAFVHVALHELVGQRILACFPSDVQGCEALKRITRSFIKHKASPDIVGRGVLRWIGGPDHV